MNNRIIKLRAIEDGGTQYEQVWDFNMDNVHTCMLRNEDDSLFTLDEYFLMIFNNEFSNIEIVQYTGINDKAGVEMCEGDRINWQGDFYIVKFSRGGFCLNPENDKDCGYYPDIKFAEQAFIVPKSIFDK